MNISPTSEGSTVEMGSAEANPVIVCGRRRSVEIRRSIGEVEDILVMETLVMLLAVMVTRLARSAEQSCLYSNFPSHRLLLASCVKLFHFVIHRHLDSTTQLEIAKCNKNILQKPPIECPCQLFIPPTVNHNLIQYHDIIMTIS